MISLKKYCKHSKRILITSKKMDLWRILSRLKIMLHFGLWKEENWKRQIKNSKLCRHKQQHFMTINFKEYLWFTTYSEIWLYASLKWTIIRKPSICYQRQRVGKGYVKEQLLIWQSHRKWFNRSMKPKETKTWLKLASRI